MIKVIFFDIDDTLLSFSGYVRETMKKGFELYGLPAYEEYMYDVFEENNSRFWRQIEEGTLTFDELLEIRWNRIFAALGISFDGKVFEKYFRQQLFDSAIAEPGAAEVLDYLQDRYTLCAASNGPYRQQINRLKIGKMHDYFSYFFISEKVGASKPKAEFFDYCFDELRAGGMSDLSPDEVMIIGDSVSSDIAGGKAYGLKTCLYSRNKKSDNSNPADYVVTDLTDIKNIL